VIVGIGLDVTSVERIERALERFGERFWERILTERERQDLATRADRAVALAGRFAAKEAASKALGGPRDVWWHDVQITRGARGIPVLSFLGPAQEHAARLGATKSLISITHDAGVAAAVVILEGA